MRSQTLGFLNRLLCKWPPQATFIGAFTALLPLPHTGATCRFTVACSLFTQVGQCFPCSCWSDWWCWELQHRRPGRTRTGLSVILGCRAAKRPVTITSHLSLPHVCGHYRWKQPNFSIFFPLKLWLKSGICLVVWQKMTNKQMNNSYNNVITCFQLLLVLSPGLVFLCYLLHLTNQEKQVRQWDVFVFSPLNNTWSHCVMFVLKVKKTDGEVKGHALGMYQACMVSVILIEVRHTHTHTIRKISHTHFELYTLLFIW